MIGNVIELEVYHLPKVGEEVGSEDEADNQGNDEELEISMLREEYLEFLMRLYIWGYPPWLTMKTTD